MNQKTFRRCPRNPFRLCLLILLTALCSFGAPAQQVGKKTDNPPEETRKCQPDDKPCRLLASLTGRIGKSPNDSAAYYMRAQIYYEKGEYRLALADVNTHIDKEGYGHSYALTLRGWIYVKLAKYDEALKDFNDALKASRDNDRALSGRGIAYYHKREYAAALGDFDRAVELNARLSVAYYYRALILNIQAKNFGDGENPARATERYQKAIRDLTAVIELDLRKADPQVYLRRAEIYEALGDPLNAAADRKTYEELSGSP